MLQNHRGAVAIPYRQRIVHVPTIGKAENPQPVVRVKPGAFYGVTPTRELLLRNRFPISDISPSVVMHGAGAEQLGNVLSLVEEGVYVLQFYYTDSCDFYLFAAFRSIGLPRRKCTNAVSRPSTTWSC
jgi:hypothetical protein